MLHSVNKLGYLPVAWRLDWTSHSLSQTSVYDENVIVYQYLQKPHAYNSKRKGIVISEYP